MREAQIYNKETLKNIFKNIKKIKGWGVVYQLGGSLSPWEGVCFGVCTNITALDMSCCVPFLLSLLCLYYPLYDTISSYLSSYLPSERIVSMYMYYTYEMYLPPCGSTSPLAYPRLHRVIYPATNVN